MRFMARLRSAAGLDPAAPLVLAGNFEVERRWARGEVGLPSFDLGASDVVVNRMDELALTLGGPGDVVLLKQQPDEDHLRHLTNLGVALPDILVPARSDPARDVVGDTLDDPALCRRLSTLAAAGGAIYPHGISGWEEELAAACGLPLAGPPATVCRAVNSKVYSRVLADKLDLRQPEGLTCESADDWQAAMRWARDQLRRGHEVAVKNAYGVSGKGILRVTDPARLDRAERMIITRLDQSGADRLALVVERWVPSAGDLNYQVTVGRDGAVTFDFVKQARTERGVHKGHDAPASLDAALHEQVVAAGSAIGAALAADGYFGVAGVDAMLDPEGGLYPIIEINARNNMSTYQIPLLETAARGAAVTRARHYTLRLTEPMSFGRLRAALGDTLLTEPGGDGLIVHNFATVNAPFTRARRTGPGDAVEGRLYAILAARSGATLNAVDADVNARLGAEQRR